MREYGMEALMRVKGYEMLVVLRDNTLNWVTHKKSTWRKKGPSGSVPVNEIILAHLGDCKQRGKSISTPSTQFTVYHVSRRSAQRWIVQAVTFTAPDAQVANSWVQTLQEQIHPSGNTRPQRLLVFINPYGGRGKASKVFRKKISPLFQLAGIETEVIETTRANHARDFILEEDLQKYDGVVCVGGDGMFSELLHGLVTRTQRDSGICEKDENSALTACRLRIGIIPAGSTDCVCFATVGINDPVTSALHIIIGDTQPMDVCASYHAEQLKRFSVSLIGYGFFGDVLRESEKLRWMGPLRYDVSGFKMVLLNRAYRGTVEFLEADDGYSNPRDNTRCRTGCLVCSESSEKLREVMEAENHCCTSNKWKKVSGSFVAINVTGMSSACPKSQDGLSPTAHLADGTADLILVHKCNMFRFLRHLKRHTSSKDQFALPYVEVHRIHAMRFIPDHEEKDDTEEDNIRRRKSIFSTLCRGTPHTSTWNCDGEILECAQISVRVHHQLIQLFARGIEGTCGS
ncbi:ceramide kinase-like [Pelobates fuscus]|uniref:ceramide kinase-like n=1 Tax=Pelobates fuscus TaxID=191477 RepID=UPI002FE458C7